MAEQGKLQFNPSFLIRAVIVWIICTFALLCSAAVLFAGDGVNLSRLGYASSVISFFSALAAGCAAGMKQGRRRFRIGCVTGLCLSAFLLLIGFLAAGRLDGSAVLSAASFTLSGCMVGALIPLKQGKRRKRISKRS